MEKGGKFTGRRKEREKDKGNVAENEGESDWMVKKY